MGTCGAEGCRTDPSSCADVCGGASLTVGRSCLGCGAARAAGSCLGGAVHVCDATSHSLCQSVTCGGMTYVCTNTGGSWAWRTALACDDGDACTFGDACGAGACTGTSVSCASTPCITRSCNGTATCTEMAHPGTSCDDGDPCTYGESCNASGACVTGSSVTCTEHAVPDPLLQRDGELHGDAAHRPELRRRRRLHPRRDLRRERRLRGRLQRHLPGGHGVPRLRVQRHQHLRRHPRAPASPATTATRPPRTTAVRPTAAAAAPPARPR
ncbi:MAG: hypothetical protein M5U28_50135 [Sandaracinaceae bacterium]|nr:hypothetical protein [Sandaracinaceae bacterium]